MIGRGIVPCRGAVPRVCSRRAKWGCGAGEIGASRDRAGRDRCGGVNELWDTIAARAGVVLSDAQRGQLSRYIDLLLEANQRMNLTRIASREAAEVQHVGDALTVLPFLPKEAHRLVDVGSGGGVPGIPLAVARPDVVVILIESTKK